jgi:hypothetical protein
VLEGASVIEEMSAEEAEAARLARDNERARLRRSYFVVYPGGRR